MEGQKNDFAPPRICQEGWLPLLTPESATPADWGPVNVPTGGLQTVCAPQTYWEQLSDCGPADRLGFSNCDPADRLGFSNLPLFDRLGPRRSTGSLSD